MSASDRQDAVRDLRKAYEENNLTLFLGAGVSRDSGIPSWNELVLLMYFSAIKTTNVLERLRPFPNYLFAIAEWHLERRREPLDITARKVRNLHKDQFLERLRETLYAGYKKSDTGRIEIPLIQDLLHKNPTLKGIADLCKAVNNGRSKIQAVITYNYDNLLELALGSGRHQSIWQGQEELDEDALPIYHVHGYIPADGEPSDSEGIVFTEDQYHQAARNAYSWSNIVQIKCLTSSVGLMVGLSLTDRNMRRLLDALRCAPVRRQNFIVIQEPRWARPDTSELRRINERAEEYQNKFPTGGRKKGENKDQEIKEIVVGR